MSAVATAEVLVEATPEDAFALFTDEIGLWWRTDTPYWNDRERGLSVRIEPRVGGRFIEVYDVETQSGLEVGRVTAWEPGKRLALTWTQVGWPEGVATRRAHEREKEPMTKYVLLYESAENVAEKAPVHFPAHSERLQRFHRDGSLLMVGPFGDPQNEGSMAIFATREAAEDFIAEDPFVLNGVVRGWQIREWDEALTA